MWGSPRTGRPPASSPPSRADGKASVGSAAVPSRREAPAATQPSTSSFDEGAAVVPIRAPARKSTVVRRQSALEHQREMERLSCLSMELGNLAVAVDTRVREETAAIVIQSAYRGHAVRKRRHSYDKDSSDDGSVASPRSSTASATAAPSTGAPFGHSNAIPEHLDANSVDTDTHKSELVDNATRNEAAIVIQAAFRGHSTRNRMHSYDRDSSVDDNAALDDSASSVSHDDDNESVELDVGAGADGMTV